MYDARFIERLKKGDKESFRELVNSGYSLYLSFAHALLKDRDAAKDIVQNVFLKLYLHRDRLSPEGNLHALILKSIRFEVANYLRLGFNYRRESDIPESTDDMTPLQSLYYDEISALVTEVLESMPDRRREVFEMSRFKGLSHAEIASALGLSVRTVEKHLELALRDLRQALGGKNEIL